MILFMILFNCSKLTRGCKLSAVGTTCLSVQISVKNNSSGVPWYQVTERRKSRWPASLCKALLCYLRRYEKKQASGMLIRVDWQIPTFRRSWCLHLWGFNPDHEPTPIHSTATLIGLPPQLSFQHFIRPYLWTCPHFPPHLLPEDDDTPHYDPSERRYIFTNKDGVTSEKARVVSSIAVSSKQACPCNS